MKTICKDTSKDIHCPMLQFDSGNEKYYCYLAKNVELEYNSSKEQLKCISQNCDINRVDIRVEKEPKITALYKRFNHTPRKYRKIIETFLPEKI